MGRSKMRPRPEKHVFNKAIFRFKQVYLFKDIRERYTRDLLNMDLRFSLGTLYPNISIEIYVKTRSRTSFY